MQNRFRRSAAFLLAVVFVVGLCLVDAEGQRRRRRRARPAPRPVVTNPDIAPPGSESTGPDGERIISTADQTPTEGEPTAEQKKTTKDATGNDQEMHQTIKQLSNQVNRLNQKLSQMEENDRSLLDMERLTRAEQRAESLRAQQVEVESKLADLQARLEVVEYAIKPENIERSNAGFGSLRPEEAREARRRQLESERARVQSQIRILETSRTRLEQALATADLEVDILRRRLEQNRQQESAGSVQPSQPPATRTPPE